MTPRLALAMVLTVSLPATGRAQADGSGLILTPAQQIAVAVTPAPVPFRADARVMGYGADGKLRELRPGSGAMICLAPDPSRQRVQAVCYHRALEPFMARGRALRSSGVDGDQVDSVRFREIRAGRLSFPSRPAALYSITGEAGSYDPAAGTIRGRALHVVYVRDATAASTGLPAEPGSGGPWIMNAGTAKAHIMFTPSM